MREYNVFPRFGDTQFVSTYISELRQKVGYYLPYIPQSLTDDATAEKYNDMILKDEQVYRCMNLLALKIAGDHTVIGGENKLLKYILSLGVTKIQGFIHARYSLAFKGILNGLALQRKYYKKVSFKAFPGLEWEVVERFQEVDRRRLRIERDPTNKNLLYWTIWAPEYDQYVILEDRKEVPNIVLGAAIQDYVWYTHQQEESYPMFFGLADILFRCVYIKNNVLKWWSQLCEKYSEPFIIAFVDAAKASIDANLGSGFTSADRRVQDYLDTFDKARGRKALVMDKSDRVEFIERGNVANNVLKELVEYCDERIQLTILNAQLGTDSADVGSYAQSSIHNQQTNLGAEFNKHQQEEVWERDLVLDFINRNIENFKVLGLGIPESLEYNFFMGSAQEEARKEALKINMSHYRGNLESMLG